MPGDLRHPKNLPQWVELDYFHRRRPLRRWVRRLTLGVLLLGSIAAGAFALTPWAARTYQAGPLSSVHALFANDCKQCHTQPFHVAGRFWPGHAAMATVSDEACSKCHPGPPHHADQTRQGELRHCSACHHEHHSSPSLTLVPDGECTVCHADLQQHSRGGSASPSKNVTSFPTGHPDFEPRRLETDGPDTRQLLFTHKAHLDGARVQKQDPHVPDGKRALQCSDCHQADAAGRYMLGVRYDNQCKECHPLTVQLSGTFSGAKAQEAARSFAREPLPHPGPGQDARVVRAALRDRLWRLVRDYPNLVGGPGPADERGVPRPPSQDDVSERQWRRVEEKGSEAERIVFHDAQAPRLEEQLFARSGGCRYCHVEAKSKRAPVQGELPIYEKPKLPAPPWLVHSRFSHERHRMMRCQDCHGSSEKDTPMEMTLPGKDLCARCHAPGANGGAGARHDCIECHSYHPSTGPDVQPRRPLALDELFKK